MRQPHAYPVQRPRFIPCGRPGCAQCHYHESEPPPARPETLARDLIAGAIGIGLLFLFLFVLLPFILGVA